jgi:hypothetical protein
MQRKIDGGKKIQSWLASYIIARESALFATRMQKRPGGGPKGDRVIGKSKTLTAEARRRGEQPRSKRKNRHAPHKDLGWVWDEVA